MQQVLIVLASALAFGASPVSAEVLQSSSQGFATKNEALVTAGAAQVWETLVEPAGYWNPEHSWFGDADGFSLDLEPGGCFCEAATAADGSSRRAEHARTIFADPGRLLRLRGAFGPLQAEALAGTLSVTLTPEGSGTRITWEYIVGGYARFPLDQIAGAVDGVMLEQLSRLTNLLERGARDERL